MLMPAVQNDNDKIGLFRRFPSLLQVPERGLRRCAGLVLFCGAEFIFREIQQQDFLPACGKRERTVRFFEIPSRTDRFHSGLVQTFQRFEHSFRSMIADVIVGEKSNIESGLADDPDRFRITVEVRTAFGNRVLL